MVQSLSLGRCSMALAFVLSLSAPVNAAESQCASPAQVEAFVVRDLQSRLMVAGLACGQQASYNAFVKSHNAQLVDAGQRLIGYFRDRSTGQRALDRHVTVAANEASRRHGIDRGAYCQKTAELFSALLGESKRPLMQVAQQATLRAVEKPVVCVAQAASPADAQNASHSIENDQNADRQ